MKSEAPLDGIHINIFTLVKTILLPLILVGFDVGSDGGVIGQMWSYVRANRTYTSSGAVREPKSTVYFYMSWVVLSSSLLNLMLSNPWASLLINARTTVLMKTRELERKDVPVPSGEH